MKVLITGTEGFIGRALATQFAKLNIDFIGLDKESPRLNSANYRMMDLMSENLDQLLLKESPDVIIHCAAQSDVEASLFDPSSDAEMNIITTVALLESFIRIQGKHFIYLQSGGAIYDYSNIFPISEDCPTKPISPYGLSKLTAEKYVEMLCNEAGIGWTSLALANCYGPVSQNKKGVIYNFWESISKGESPTINGPKVTRDFIHILDVVDAVFRVLEKPLNSRINISSGKEVSLEQLFKLICDVLDSKITPSLNSPVKGQILRSSLSNKKARIMTGWEPRIDIRTGIEMMKND